MARISDPNAPAAAVMQDNWRRYRRALALVAPLGLTVALACLGILLSYATGFERGYQLSPAEPGTSPMTAFALLLLAAGLASHRPLRKSNVELVLAFTAIAIAILRLAEISFGFSVLPGTSVQPNPLAQPISFGWNSALGITMCGSALLSAGRAQSAVTQTLAGLALAVPLVAFVGYSYGLTAFHGRTSLYTAILLFLLATGILLASSRSGIMRVCLDPFGAGRLARVQLLGAVTIPYLVGDLLLQTGAGTEALVIGFGVAMTAAFMVVLMSTSLLALDRAERKRRCAERTTHYEATHDHLTGLANRRMFLAVTALDLARSIRGEMDACLVMADIDHFKTINDTCGHEAGDRVLRRLAGLIARNVRKGDLPARLGGEEFAVFLPRASTHDAAVLAERLRHAIETTDFSAETGGQCQVTISVGVAERDGGTDRLDSLLRAADAALYAAKEKGRNRVEFANRRAA